MSIALKMVADEAEQSLLGVTVQRLGIRCGAGRSL
jgi:hypothetical protein